MPFKTLLKIEKNLVFRDGSVGYTGEHDDTVFINSFLDGAEATVGPRSTSLFFYHFLLASKL